jgi:hypothetical protein
MLQESELVFCSMGRNLYVAHLETESRFQTKAGLAIMMKRITFTVLSLWYEYKNFIHRSRYGRLIMQCKT